MNESNLIPFTSEQSREEAEKNGRKGGKKSGEVRRRKRNLKAAMKSVLALPVNDIDRWNAISALGVDPVDIDNQTAIVCALMSKALAGDVAAFKEIRSLLGEDNEAERVKLQKKQLELAERKADGGEDETPDDGFLEALNGSAAEDWSGENDED